MKMCCCLFQAGPGSKQKWVPLEIETKSERGTRRRGGRVARDRIPDKSGEVAASKPSQRDAQPAPRRRPERPSSAGGERPGKERTMSGECSGLFLLHNLSGLTHTVLFLQVLSHVIGEQTCVPWALWITVAEEVVTAEAGVEGVGEGGAPGEGSVGATRLTTVSILCFKSWD